MTKITDQKILELAMTSSDPMIRETVDKLIFALKLKHTNTDLVDMYDNHEYHHGVRINLPTTGEMMQVAVLWKRNKFRVMSFEHQFEAGTTSDFMGGKPLGEVYLKWDPIYKVNPKTGLMK